MASGIRGLTKLRRTLRRIEPEITQEVKQAIRDGAEAIKWDAKALAPRDEGDLANAIDATFSSDGLAAVIGPGSKGVQAERRAGRAAARGRTIVLSARSTDLLWQFYKGLWHEFGTKGYPAKNIPPLPARPFMGPAYDMNEDWIKGNVRRAIAEALKKASAGGGSVNG